MYSDRIPVTNVFKTAVVTGATPSPRRTVVNIARCNACHESLSLHGSNRTDEPQVCVICHNPAATDINRPKGRDDGRVGELCAGAGLDDRRPLRADHRLQAHGAHDPCVRAATGPMRRSWVYGFGNNPIDFAEVTYPAGGKISQCESCHEPDTYYPVDPTRVQATTTDTGASITSQTDDLGITPNTAVCSGCHTDSTSALHMTQNGGNFDAPKPANGIVTSPLETCGRLPWAGPTGQHEADAQGRHLQARWRVVELTARE